MQKASKADDVDPDEETENCSLWIDKFVNQQLPFEPICIQIVCNNQTVFVARPAIVVCLQSIVFRTVAQCSVDVD